MILECLPVSAVCGQRKSRCQMEERLIRIAIVVLLAVIAAGLWYNAVCTTQVVNEIRNETRSMSWDVHLARRAAFPNKSDWKQEGL